MLIRCHLAQRARTCDSVRREEDEEPLNGEKSLKNPLGIIHSIDTDSHKRRFHIQIAQQSGAFDVEVGFAGFDAVIFGECHADGKRPHDSAMVPAQHREVLPIHARFDHAINGLQKIVAMRLNVKPDQVRAEEAIHQLALPGTNAKSFEVRPGDMPENRHPRIRPFFLDHPRQ